MNVVTPIVALVLALNLAVRLWLGLRQIRHVERHAQAVPEAFAGVIGLPAHQRAAHYTIARQRLALAEAATGTVVFAVFTWGGVLQAIHEAVAQSLEPGLAREATVVVAAALALWLTDLPFDLVRRFGVEQRFGFNRMGPGLFLADLLKGAALAALLGVPLLCVVLLVMQHAGPYWWLAAWAVWAAFSLALSVLYPTLIAPVFNRFSPLPDGPLRQRVDALLARTGFRSNGVFTMDGSRRSSHGNAYFTGMGAGKRIVFFDTLVERLGPGEVEAVLAHELGHFRLHHVTQRIAIGLAVALLWLSLLAWLRAQPGLTAALGVAGGGDGAVLVLFALVLPLFTFLAAPLQSAFSRQHEFAADAFAARHASARDLVAALVKLYEDNASTLTPDPVHSAFYDSHPPAALRIAQLQAPVPAAAS